MTDKKIPKKIGRPTVLTPQTLDKLRNAFLIGCSDDEACAYAEISTTALYDYQTKHKEYTEQKDQWKREPILKAKTTVVKSLGDVRDAQWYLERRAKKEFSLRSELTGADGEKLPTPILQGIIDVHSDDSSKKAK